MLLTQRIFKPVILALLVLLSFGATAGADAEKKCFEYSDLPSLPNKATVECAWGFPDGLAAVQADKLFVLKDGAEKWVQVDSGPLGIGASAITTSAAGKLYVVDGVKVFTLGFAEDTLERVRTELTDLPVAIREGDAEVIVDEVAGDTLYVAGLDSKGTNVFIADGKAVDAWSPIRARRVLMAQLQGKVYVFSDQEGADGLATYVYTPRNGGWKALGMSEFAVKAEEAFACGDAHILFAGKGAEKLAALYVTQKRWVHFDTDPLPTTDFAVASDHKSFTILTPQGVRKTKAVFPGTKYGIWDHLIVAVFFILMLWMGKHFSKREKSKKDFFRGGNRLPWWAVGLSMFATGASAISLMAMPAKAYTDNWLYFMGGPIQILFLPVVFVVVIPIARRLNFSSAFEYLEARYCRPVRMFGSIAFAASQILGRMATIMLLPAIALSAICGMPLHMSILIMGVVTTIYCMMGGLEAVVWTDVIQAFVMLAAMILCVIWVFASLNVPGSEAMNLISSEQKLVMMDFSWDVTQPIIYIILLTSAFQSLAGLGDQNFIQRVQAVPTEKDARKAAATQLFVAVPLNACLFGLGTCLFIYYHYNAADISPAMKADGIFPLFAAQKLPTGLAGVVVAALMAATMSTLSSALNSVSNVAVEDYVRRFKKELTDHQALIWGKGMTVVLGVIGTGLALWLVGRGATSIWDMFILITGVLFSPMASMFMLGVLTTRVHTGGIIAGYAAGISVTLFCKYNLSLHPFFFGPLGLISSLVVAYVASVIFPRKTPRDLTGLTVFSLPPKPDEA